ncbi:BRI3-binding protein [Hemiscyllium ocellatum]|uniref:BRI3-binding protein n=1 Tax=Hemiscyllium ocellatum TaxID=170820 RepID=UPI002966D98A|nr:BRI3-binding protein [Hemiscyllium ocellatum]
MAALCGQTVTVMAMAAALLAASFVSVDAVKSRRQAGNEKQNNFFRRAASGVSRNLAAVFGEENVQAVQKFFSRITEQFVFGMDVLLQTIWKIWMDLLDILGIDGSNVSQYLNPTTAVTHPTQVLLLVVAVLVAYWFLSMFIGLIFYTLRITCGGCFWIARIVFFALACLYILQKSEGDPEGAVLPLCFVVLTYIMTGPVGFYWRRNTSHVEEKLEHLDGQIRLMNIRLNRVLEKLDQNAG